MQLYLPLMEKGLESPEIAIPLYLGGAHQLFEKKSLRDPLFPLICCVARPFVSFLKSWQKQSVLGPGKKNEK